MAHTSLLSLDLFQDICLIGDELARRTYGSFVYWLGYRALIPKKVRSIRPRVRSITFSTCTWYALLLLKLNINNIKESINFGIHLLDYK